MCCFHLQGACGINWRKGKRQQYRIIARIVPDKGNVQPKIGHEIQEWKLIGILLLKFRVETDRWSKSRPGHFTPGKDRVPIVYEAGWITGSVWTGAENLAAARIRSSNRPACSESLHRLRYPCPRTDTQWTQSLLPVIPETK